eukprot:COSAG02_NODE_3301_length_6982_cov_81.442685_6_plen_47_part_01
MGVFSLPVRSLAAAAGSDSRHSCYGPGPLGVRSQEGSAGEKEGGECE